MPPVFAATCFGTINWSNDKGPRHLHTRLLRGEWLDRGTFGGSQQGMPLSWWVFRRGEQVRTVQNHVNGTLAHIIGGSYEKSATIDVWE